VTGTSQLRNTIGTVLLSATALAWIAAATVVGTAEHAHWSDPIPLGLIIAGALSLIAATAVLTGPHREPKPRPSAASEFAEAFLKEEGLSPGRWQRLRHPRTPVGQLPVRVPKSVRAQYRARQDALQEFIDELESNRRDLAIQVETGQRFGVVFPGSAWAKHRHLLNSDDLVWTRPLVQDAYLRTYALNQKTEPLYDAASAADVNDPEWKKLSDDEMQERQEALAAVVSARSAVNQARNG
jgi:hypothetical protein